MNEDLTMRGVIARAGGALLLVCSLLFAPVLARAQDTSSSDDELRTAVMGEIGGVEIALDRAVASFRAGDAEEARSWLAAAQARAPRRVVIGLARRATHERIDPALVLSLDAATATERLEEITRADDRRSLANVLGATAIAFNLGVIALPLVGVLDGTECRRSSSLTVIDCDGRFGGFVAGSALAGVVALGLIGYAIVMHVLATDEVNAWVRRLRAGASGIEIAQW